MTPTRDAELRSSVPGLGIESWAEDDLMDLALVPPTKRWASNWLRLLFKLRGVSALRFLHPTEKRCLPGRIWRGYPLKKFDDTLGFPGEGPGGVNHFLCYLLLFLIYVDFVLSELPFYVDFALCELPIFVDFALVKFLVHVDFVLRYLAWFLAFSISFTCLGLLVSHCSCCVAEGCCLLAAPWLVGCVADAVVCSWGERHAAMASNTW